MLEWDLSSLLCDTFNQMLDDPKLYYHDFTWHFLLQNGSVWVMKGDTLIQRNYLKKKLMFYGQMGRVRGSNKGWRSTQQPARAGKDNRPQPEKPVRENVVPGLPWWLQLGGNHSGAVATERCRQWRTWQNRDEMVNKYLYVLLLLDGNLLSNLIWLPFD